MKFNVAKNFKKIFRIFRILFPVWLLQNFSKYVNTVNNWNF